MCVGVCKHHFINTKYKKQIQGKSVCEKVQTFEVKQSYMWIRLFTFFYTEQKWYATNIIIYFIE